MNHMPTVLEKGCSLLIMGMLLLGQSRVVYAEDIISDVVTEYSGNESLPPTTGEGGIDLPLPPLEVGAVSTTTDDGVIFTTQSTSTDTITGAVSEDVNPEIVDGIGATSTPPLASGETHNATSTSISISMTATSSVEFDIATTTPQISETIFPLDALGPTQGPARMPWTRGGRARTRHASSNKRWAHLLRKTERERRGVPHPRQPQWS